MRQGLTKKRITDKNGHSRVVWVKPNDYEATEYHGLKKPNSQKELIEGVNIVLSQYGQKETASARALSYFNEHADLAKEYLSENGIKDKEGFDKHMGKLHRKARKPILEERKQARSEYVKQKTEATVKHIFQIAKETNDKFLQ